LPPIKPVLARDQSTILARFGLVFQSLLRQPISTLNPTSRLYMVWFYLTDG
jgi:hypothetical protein